MIRPRCVVPGCNEPRFYDTEGSPCLAHVNNPPQPKRQPPRRPEPPAVVDESESSD